MTNDQRYPVLAKTDANLLKEIFRRLNQRLNTVDMYSRDGSYSAAIQPLPIGLRAMAATQCLDISLTLDDLGWHFLNFGEPGLVALTAAGLRELGLTDLAAWFAEAHLIVDGFI